MVGTRTAKKTTSVVNAGKRALRPVVLAALVLLAYTAVAQSYAVTDTVTEYNNYGTYYHDRLEGRKTASGEIFDQNKFTAAHWKIKLGTLVMVTNHNTGLQVIVKVNDRCPKHGVLDMSHRAATAVGIKGCQKVTVRILPDGYEGRWAAQETKFDSVYSRLTGKQPTQQKAATATATTKKEKPVEKKAETKQTPPYKEDCYNLTLENEIAHAEAFESIKNLPELYRSKVIVEPAEDSGMVRMTLDVKLPQESAEKLRRALKHSFKNIVLTTCD